MLEIIKKYRSKMLKYGLLSFTGCILIVQLPYWIGDFLLIIKTDFSAADILGFLGDYISALGTIILGWIAIKQTEKANSISDRVAKLEMDKYKEEHEPTVLIDWVKLHDFSYNKTACKIDFDGQLHYIDAKYESNVNEERQCIEINLVNTGRCGIYNCELVKVSSQPKELEKGVGLMGRQSSPFNLIAGEEIKFNLFLYSNVVERFAIMKIESIQLTFMCVNGFNEKYKLILDVAGSVQCCGNNRYEGSLIPAPHPVKWEMQVERVESF